MILVTGAAGKTGRQLIRRLADTGAEVRALVRTPEQVEPLLALGAREAVTGDLLEVADVSAAMEGVRAVYHICPNVHPGELEIGGLAIEAAAAAGLDRFVFHSVLYPDVEAMPHHWLKFRVEQKLRASGLTSTILRPCAYMQNLLAYLPAMRDRGRLAVPFSVLAAFTLVDLRDVASAAAKVLLGAGHEGRTYDLCGPEALSHTRMAGLFESALGRPVEALGVDSSEWEEEARVSGLSEYAIDALRRMFLWYDRHGFAGGCGDLESLPERPASPLADFVREVTAR